MSGSGSGSSSRTISKVASNVVSYTTKTIDYKNAKHDVKGVSVAEANENNLRCKHGHIGCWVVQKNGNTITRRCQECSRTANKKERALTPDRFVSKQEARALRVAEGLCRDCCRGRAAVGHISCLICLERRRQANKLATQKAKDIIFNWYGRSCVCCGEAEPLFLTLDHINGNGKQDRGKNQSNLTWYHNLAKKIRLGSPPADLRVLCYNCNCGRQRNGGICPHAHEKSVAV